MSKIISLPQTTSEPLLIVCLFWILCKQLTLQKYLCIYIFFLLLAFQPTRHRNITYWSYFSVGYYWNAELPKQFHCNMCEKSFASYQSLTNHTAVHEGKTTCQQCGKVESTRSNLARHIKSCHSLGQLWMYFWCNINLFSMAKLFILSSVAGFWNYDFVGGSYSRGSYEKQGLYQCPQCDKRFESPKSLSNHQAVHDGKTTCNICGKVESTRSNLNRHVKITHPETCVL